VSEVPPPAPECGSCAARDVVIEELVRANAELLERVERLERASGRNSGNSSMPPSTDDLPGKKKPAPRRGTGSGRRRGKQNGAQGSALAWAADPDERVAHRPGGVCGCGTGLGEAVDVGVERSHQTHDLPEVRITIRQHDVYRVRCGCGAEHVAGQPDGVSRAPSSYGPNLRALVVYLLVYQHVPVARCVELIAALGGGAGPSTGFVHSTLARAATAVAEVVAGIKTLIAAAHVVGFDETTLRAGPAGTRRYVLSASTEEHTTYYLGRRDLASFTAFDVLPRFAGIAVHDRYQNYFNPTWSKLAGHQACCAHLLRDFTDAAESHSGAHWPVQAQGALRGLIHSWHQARDADLPAIPASVGDPLIREFRAAIRVGLAQVRRVPGPRNSTAQIPGRDLLEFCRDHDGDVLRFVTDTRVWPTNNISERDLRPTKTQQKISGRLTSEDVTQHRLDIRSYIDTVRKHGLNIITALRGAVSGDPWHPPALAPT